jgi:hypothetical protein
MHFNIIFLFVLVCPSSLLPSGFPTKCYMQFLFSPICSTWTYLLINKLSFSLYMTFIKKLTKHRKLHTFIVRFLCYIEVLVMKIIPK